MRLKVAVWYWCRFVAADRRCLCSFGLSRVCGRIEDFMFEKSE